MGNRVNGEFILIAIRRLGIELTVIGDRLRYQPAAAMPADLLDGLREHKAEIIELLTSKSVDGATPACLADTARLFAMPLDTFARSGQTLEIRVHWLDVTLFFVPGHTAGETLIKAGVGRGRIWSADELIRMMALAEHMPSAVQTVALAKLALDGDIAEVRSQRGGS